MNNSTLDAYIFIKNVLLTSELSDGRKMAEINNFFNTYIKYVPDGAKDHWQTLDETLARGCGDCEDFAIAKYTLALKVGIKPEDLMLVYCYQEDKQAHLVLVWDCIIYDNAREGGLECKHSKLVPVYGFNITSRFLLDKEWNKISTKHFPLKKWDSLNLKV
jgi:predicted transglutaminase-like cysteine proteinase